MISFFVALAFTFLTIPVWVIIGTIKGVFIFLYEFASKAFWLIKNTLLIEQSISFWDSAPLIIVIPLRALWLGLLGFTSTLGSFWDWARYGHPWWAFLICIGLTIFYVIILVLLVSEHEKREKY